MLYFVPRVKALAPRELHEVGLAHAIDSPITRETTAGPGNQGGILVADASLVSASELRYVEGQQVWRKLSNHPDSPSVGICRTALPPGPDQLARRRGLPGPTIQLLDGNQWTIPLVRTWSADDADPRILFSDALPKVLDVDDDGNFVAGGFVPQFAWLAERAIAAADSVYDQLTGRDSTGATLEPQHVLHLAVELLGTNYRLGRVEVALMRLLTSELANEIVSLAIDLDALKDSLKNLASRRISGGTNSPSGGEPPTADVSTPTDRPSAS